MGCARNRRPLWDRSTQSSLLRLWSRLGPVVRRPLPAPPAPRLSADRLTLQVPFNPSLTDIIYRVYASPDLIDWPEILFDSDHDAPPAFDDGWLVLPLETSDRMFFRIGIHPRES